MNRRRKKNTRHRGTKVCGWGSGKRHRGSGNRGGVGMAGSGKRSHNKKHSQNPMEYFGRVGFTSIKQVKTKVNAINLYQLPNLEAKSGVLDLTELGYTKLLGKGDGIKITIKVNKASANAIAKIEGAGGKVEVFEPSDEIEEAEEAEEKPKAAQPKAKELPKPQPKKVEVQVKKA